MPTWLSISSSSTAWPTSSPRRLPAHRRALSGLARRLARLLPPPAREEQRQRRGARLDRGRARRAAAAGQLGGDVPRAPNLGLYCRPLPDRSDLVDLPVLAA